MTRVRISICMIAFMIGLSIFSGIWINKSCDSLLERAGNICIACEEGDNRSAAAEAEMLEIEWVDFRKKAAVLLKYDKLYELDRIVSRAKYVAENKPDEIMPQMAELMHMLDILRRNEIPLLWN